MKNKFVCFVFSAMGTVLLSCESGTKNEWGILQQIEADKRCADLDSFYFKSVGKYNFVAISTESARVWVLLNPRHAPFYKQLPITECFTISEDQLAQILRMGASEIVVEHLKLHALANDSSRGSTEIESSTFGSCRFTQEVEGNASVSQ